jgi:hypothetical protein
MGLAGRRWAWRRISCAKVRLVKRFLEEGRTPGEAWYCGLLSRAAKCSSRN